MQNEEAALSTHKKFTAPLLLACVHGLLARSVFAAAVDCSQWNTEAFFERASAGEVQACLASGADPLARNQENAIPWSYAEQNVHLKGREPWRRLRDASL